MSWFRRRASGPKRIGLALGGGAVRGAAHIGVISVLEREGMRPDFIAGTSAGALVGAAWAAGLSSAEMHELMQGLSWGDIADIAWRKPMSVFSTSPLRKFIEHAVDGVEFSGLSTPFAAVACDILSGSRVVITEGPVAAAALASAAIPGLFPPIEHDEMLLVDGGIVDNLPVDVVRKMGADLVIAVDIILPVGQSHRPTNMRDMFAATVDVAALSTQSSALESADLVIRPELQGIPAWEFGAIGDIEARGRQAAEAALPQLRELFAQQAPLAE
ncbi:MAG: patatin-like phospholipase family protein [Actinobacteria bacterium]|nr:patatin-like phospholipase family protein [Actinomycetota bacterium]MCG2808260.1 patatin-like phospholipase family protein [Coriobacteriia bacterium]